MTLLVSIDPGLSTGVALFQNGQYLRSFTSYPPHDQLASLLGCLRKDDEVVAEKGPTNHRRQAAACEPVERLVHEVVVPVSWVRPTQWKGTPSACLRTSDKPGTKHEKDAIRIGRWHLAHVGATG